MLHSRARVTYYNYPGKCFRSELSRVWCELGASSCRLIHHAICPKELRSGFPYALNRKFELCSLFDSLSGHNEINVRQRRNPPVMFLHILPRQNEYPFLWSVGCFRLVWPLSCDIFRERILPRSTLPSPDSLSSCIAVRSCPVWEESSRKLQWSSWKTSTYSEVSIDFKSGKRVQFEPRLQ